MKIYSVHVNKIPESCGGCALMGYINDSYPVCYGIADEEKREIEGNPYSMQYRRSDCPLVRGAEGNVCKQQTEGRTV
jgi:hypothetical protein